MLPGIPLWETEPQVTNEQGTKFWFQRELTEYLHENQLKGQVLLAETVDGLRSYLIAQGGQAVYTDQQYEGIACRIDAMVAARDFGDEE